METKIGVKEVNPISAVSGDTKHNLRFYISDVCQCVKMLFNESHPRYLERRQTRSVMDGLHYPIRHISLSPYTTDKVGSHYQSSKLIVFRGFYIFSRGYSKKY